MSSPTAGDRAFWRGLTGTSQISNKRRVVVQKFKGSMFVNLREYYEDSSGEMKPGKKVGPVRLRYSSRLPSISRIYAHASLGNHAVHGPVPVSYRPHPVYQRSAAQGGRCYGRRRRQRRSRVLLGWNKDSHRRQESIHQGKHRCDKR